jgi:hypothetical protein
MRLQKALIAGLQKADAFLQWSHEASGLSAIL